MRQKTIGYGIVGLLALALARPAAAQEQDIFMYPQRGQSPEQQQRDRNECHLWAVQQIGLDPTSPQLAQAPAAPPPLRAEAPEGGVLRGGARGAALGAVGGAIAGDAGKGAAIGAATGALIGGMRRADQVRRQEAEMQQYQQQAEAAAQQSAASAAYRRALGACLSGRGYTVR